VSTIVDTEHVCRRHAYEDIPRIVQQTKRLLIDHHRWRWRLPEPDVQIAQSIAAEVTSTRADGDGERLKTSADLATFVNGVMIRFLDYNDGYTSTGIRHPSDSIGRRCRWPS